jgi:hypothetical protein
MKSELLKMVMIDSDQGRFTMLERNFNPDLMRPAIRTVPFLSDGVSKGIRDKFEIAGMGPAEGLLLHWPCYVTPRRIGGEAVAVSVNARGGESAVKGSRFRGYHAKFTALVLMDKVWRRMTDGVESEPGRMEYAKALTEFPHVAADLWEFKVGKKSGLPCDHGHYLMKLFALMYFERVWRIRKKRADRPVGCEAIAYDRCAEFLNMMVSVSFPKGPPRGMKPFTAGNLRTLYRAFDLAEKLPGR